MPIIISRGMGNEGEHLVTMIPKQLTLSYEPGLTQRYRNLREVVATGVYQRGVTRVAGQMDVAPSKLSEKLSGGTDRPRDVTLDEFERYLTATGDVQPIHYLIERFLGDPQAQQLEALQQLASLAERLPAMLAAAGLQKAPRR